MIATLRQFLSPNNLETDGGSLLLPNWQTGPTNRANSQICLISSRQFSSGVSCKSKNEIER